jgi:hypothetical protein
VSAIRHHPIRNVHLQVLPHNGRGIAGRRARHLRNARSALAGNRGKEVELDLAYNGMRASRPR